MHWTYIGVEIFYLAQFLLKLIEQLVDLRKKRTENLKFRTDLRDQVTDGWSVTEYMIVYNNNLQQFIHPAPARGPSRFCPHRKGRRPFAKADCSKNLKIEIKACPVKLVNTCLTDFLKRI